MDNQKNVIVTNRMYAGDYIIRDNNIGHEIINLFKTDKGENYIYLQAKGTYSKKWLKYSFDTILLVRRVGKDVFEVLGKAKIKENLISNALSKTKAKTDEEFRKELNQEQIKYIKEKDIKYGGVYLNEILKDNQNDGDAVFVTFKAESVIRPKQVLYITANKEYEDENKNVYYVSPHNKNFEKQALKMYFIDGESGYEDLNNLILKTELWMDENDTENVSDILYLGDKDITFLDIIKKNNDELIFSNLIAYYLSKYRPLLQRFMKEVLKIDFKLKTDINIKIEREKDNIDIFITYEDNAIIIENKIKSGINGLRFDENTKEEISSQLGKYIEQAEKQYPIEKIKCFIFTPNYNRIDKDKHSGGKEYTIVKYSELYEFFKKYTFGVDNYYFADQYYNDFVRALRRHSKEYDNNLYEEMKERFIKSIMERKEK